MIAVGLGVPGPAFPRALRRYAASALLALVGLASLAGAWILEVLSCS